MSKMAHRHQMDRHHFTSIHINIETVHMGYMEHFVVIFHFCKKQFCTKTKILGQFLFLPISLCLYIDNKNFLQIISILIHLFDIDTTSKVSWSSIKPRITHFHRQLKQQMKSVIEKWDKLGQRVEAFRANMVHYETWFCFKECVQSW